jgi:hypothetical protein
VLSSLAFKFNVCRHTKQKGDNGLLLQTTESGALFKSYRDGSRVAGQCRLKPVFASTE